MVVNMLALKSLTELRQAFGAALNILFLSDSQLSATAGDQASICSAELQGYSTLVPTLYRLPYRCFSRPVLPRRRFQDGPMVVLGYCVNLYGYSATRLFTSFAPQNCGIASQAHRDLPADSDFH